MANSLLNGEEPATPAPQKADTRVFMYRGQEARLFASLDEVPKDEGWRDAPYEPEESVEKPKRGRRPKAETEAESEPVNDGDSDAD